MSEGSGDPESPLGPIMNRIRSERYQDLDGGKAVASKENRVSRDE
jgi:hypothetical protein